MARKITFKMFRGILLLCFLPVLSFAQGDNNQDPTVNLGLLSEATVTGSVVPADSGRGLPTDILYDPAIQGFRNKTDWQEYGVAYGKNLGPVSKDNPFYWMVEWPTAKNINYITVGGVYGNQPQPYTMWAVQIWENGTWTTLAKAQDGWRADSLMGQGGWLDQGILKWRGLEPVVTQKLRIIAYSDSDLVSIHFRGRGGNGLIIQDSTEATKAILIQYLDFSNEVADNEMDDMVNLGLLDEAVVSSVFKAGEMEFIRGEPSDILFDPKKNNFYNEQTAWAEFGYPWQYDAGYPTETDSAFYYMVEWPVPKNINYFTWGGVYGNQPQPNTLWAVEYWDNGWVTVLDGVGGSLEEGVPGVDADAESVWQTDTPIQSTKFRLVVFSDGINSLFSYSLRGRGGSTLNWDETDSTFKAILLQYRDLVTGVETDKSTLPDKFSLDQNYPNPFNPQTNIGFYIQKQGYVKLSVYNLLGQEVAVLVNGVKSVGSYKVQFDGTNLSSGLYFYRLESNQQIISKKMMLLK